MSLIDLRYTQPPMVLRPCYDRWSRRGHPARRAAAQSKRVLLVRPSGRRNEPIRVTDEVSTVFAVPAVQVNNLRKEFIRRDGGSRKRGRRRRVAALQGLSFTMQRGECLAILGQNGSGKSTLVRLLSTLLINDGGSARVFGIDVFDKPRSVQRLVNRVSVEASFFKRMSPMENLSYSARFYGMGPRETRARIPEILALVGFPPERGHEPMEDLSRGMQQKIALARALLTAPVLLLLDEPTTGLDPRSKLEVQDFIRQMREHHDSTILLCTHDLAEAEALADRIGILHRGELLCLESAEEIRQRYHADTLEQAFLNATGRSFEDEDEESRRGVPA
jgi:ABC-2 type transport system ATP-binding protein